MGKKASRHHHQQQPPTPSSKNDKKQLHTLIKVLKPKVYITDPSTFKALVQELTGNATAPISSSPPPLPPHPLLTHLDDDDDELDYLACHPSPPQPQLMPITHIDGYDELDHAVCHGTSSIEFSVDSYIPAPVTMFEGSPYLSSPTPFVSRSHAHDRQMDFSQYKDDIESWLLELEPFPFGDHAYAPHIQQEICVYDYNISGFI